MQDETKAVLNALWGTMGKPHEHVQPFAAQAANRKQWLGKVIRREYGGRLFLLRIERQGKEPEDAVFIDRADFNTAAKKAVENFEKEISKIKHRFEAEAAEEAKQRGPPTFEIPSDWGPVTAHFLVDEKEVSPVWVGQNRLGIDIDYQILKRSDSRGEPDKVESHRGEIEFNPPPYFEESLRIAKGVLFRRMNAAATDPAFIDLSPLMRNNINAAYPAAAYSKGVTVEMVIDMPREAREIIEKRRRQLVGE